MIVPLVLVALQLGGAAPQAATSLDDSFDASARMVGVLEVVLPAAMERNGAPGIALAIVGLGDGPTLRAWGDLRSGSGRSVVPESTTFRVASVSKLFVATMAALLQDRGLVDLDRPIDAYLPEFAAQFPLGVPTLAQLLTHTSGLGDLHIGMFARSPQDLRPLGEYLQDRLPVQAASPGDRTAYSNHGIALAALVLEQVGGRPFDELIGEELLQPLGMISSSFSQPLSDDLLARLAAGHRCGSDECVPLQLDYRQAYPAGGLATTAADMARFLELHLGSGDAAILSPQALEAMHGLAFTHDPRLNAGMALGFFRHQRRGVQLLTHGGSSSGYHALVAILPDEGIGLFAVTNGGAATLLSELLDAVLEAVAPGAAIPQQAAPVQPDPATADILTGVYLETVGTRSGVERFPALFQFQETLSLDGEGWLARDEGGGTRRYGQIAPLLFRQIDGDDYLAFRMNESGRVTHLFTSASFAGSERPAAYLRLAPYDDPWFVNEALSWTLMIPLLVLFVLWPVTVLIGRRMRRSRGPSEPVARRWGSIEAGAVLIAIAFSVAATLFGFGFGARLNRMLMELPEELAYGMPPELARFAWLGNPTLILGAALPFLAVVTWRRGRWGVGERLYFTAVTISGVALVALFVRHGLIPPAW